MVSPKFIQIQEYKEEKPKDKTNLQLRREINKMKREHTKEIEALKEEHSEALKAKDAEIE